MVGTTPFYPRLRELNQTGLWTHWSGHLSALRYGNAPKHEYFAVRNSAGVFDTSPLFKYWIRGRDAARFLAGLLTRDVRSCRAGQAHYTVWCDDAGWVLEDGVVFRHADDEFFMTTARPNLGYFSSLVGRLEVSIEDVTDEYGVLAVQGPRSRQILSHHVPEVAGLRFFHHTPAKIGSAPVTVSRTGYTGDLGYEIFVGRDHALDVLDAVLQAGQGHGLRPFGEEALLMLRIEAGLALIGVEFASSRYAFTDAERVTPNELGLGWMLRGIESGDRAFVGRQAILCELRDGTSRWSSVGLVVDWRAYDELFTSAGLIPPKDERPLGYESMLYGDSGERIGYATSLMYSPVLQRHIALARVRPAYSHVGATVDVELTVDHEYRTVPAEVARLPLFKPERKTA
jgi:aminomethyltransferase